MIITHLHGGLGNQMFQYAAGLTLAERRRTIQKLDPSWFQETTDYEPHNKYGLHPFNILEQFATSNEVNGICGRPRFRGQQRLIRMAGRLGLKSAVSSLQPQGRYYSPGFRYDPMFLNQRDNTYLHGEWQSEQFFASTAPLVRLHFTFRFPISEAAKGVATRIQEEPGAVAIHFRRGDYVRNAQAFREISSMSGEQKRMAFESQMAAMGYTVPLPMEYYHLAVRAMLHRVPEPKFFIFSDDIPAVRNEFRPDVRHEFVHGNWEPFEDLRLMSMCKHIIVANSSFSWWGAWLNSSMEKVVIAPDPWFGGGTHDDSDIVPVSWQRVSRGNSDACSSPPLPTSQLSYR